MRYILISLSPNKVSVRSTGTIQGRNGLLPQVFVPADNGRRTLQLHPNILRTCKTIFEEASSVLIQRNHFVYHSARNSLHLQMRRARRDRSWDVMLNRYHCNPPHYPSGLGGSSHRIRHLDIRLFDYVDLRTVNSTLPHLLYAQNTLKTLNLEVWALWDRHYLSAIFRAIDHALGCVRLTITAFQYQSYVWCEEETFKGLGEAIRAWCDIHDREFVVIESRLSDEDLLRIKVLEGLEKQLWLLLP